MSKESNCIVCGQPLHGRQTKFCSPVCKNKDLQSYEAQKRRGLANCHAELHNPRLNLDLLL